MILRPYSSLPILMYHQIADLDRHQDPARLAVPPAQFARHLAWLQAQGYRSLSLDEAAAAWARGEFLPKTVVISFDDGYLDNYTAAFPLLQEYGFRASIFLVADFIGQAQSRWGKGPEVNLMNWAQAREMQEYGIEFHSHGCTHSALDRLKTAALQRELRDARSQIEDHLGAAVRHIAYPYGAYSQQVLSEAEAAGYTAGYAAGLAHDGPLALPRFCVGRNDGPGWLRFKTSPWGNWLRGFDIFH